MKGFKAFAGLEAPSSLGQNPSRNVSHGGSQGSSSSSSMSLLEAHAKIMRARQSNLQLKHELGRLIMMDNENQRAKQQLPQQLPPLGNQGKSSDPFLMEKIAQLEKALESLTQSQQQKQGQQAVPPPESKPGPSVKMAAEKFLAATKKTRMPPQPSSGRAGPAPVAQPLPRDRGEAVKVMEEQQQQLQQSQQQPPPQPPPQPRRVPPLPLAPSPAAPAVPTALPSVDPKKLSTLAEQISAEVEENSKLLGKYDGEGRDDENKATLDRDEAKNRMRKLMQRAEKHFQKLPLWRHRLKGVRDPPPEAVLKGKALFRGIAKAVICLLLRPKLTILRRRAQFRAKETAELAKDMVAYSEFVCAWLGRTAKVPLSSAEQDATLDLDPRPVGPGSATGKQRLMHLKVRVKGVVSALVDAPMPLEHICKFLVMLMEDNNYFPVGYLSEEQRSVLEFSDLGGTRNMLLAVGDELNAAEPPPTLLEGMKRREHLMGAKKDRRVDVTRARMVLVDYLLVRMLLGQCVLRPWRHGVCKAPKRRAGQVVNNLRMIGTCLYYILKQTEGYLPMIARLAPEGDEKDAAATASAAAAGASAASEEAPPPSRLGAFLGGLTGPSIQADAAKQKKQVDDALIHQIVRVDADDYFRPQTAVLGELVPADEMAAAKAYIDEWLPDLVVKMDDYIKRLMEHLFEVRTEIRGASFDDEIEALRESDKHVGLLSPRATMMLSPRLPLPLPLAAAAPAPASGRPATKTSARPGTRQKLAPPPPTPK